MAPRPDLAFSSSSFGNEVLLPVAMNAPAKKQPQLTKSNKSSSMPRATSMPEMSEVRDMINFGEEMNARSGEQTFEAIADDQGGDSGFFIEWSEHSDEDVALQREGSNFLKVFAAAEQANRPAPAFIPPPAKAKIGGLRRVMSLASLPSASARRISLTAIIPIHAISEEDIVDSASKTETAEFGLDASIQGRKPFGSRSSLRSTSSEVGLDASIQGRKPFKRSASTNKLPSRANGPDSAFHDARPVGRRMSFSSALGLDASMHQVRRYASSASLRSPSVIGTPLRSSKKGSKNSFLSSTGGLDGSTHDSRPSGMRSTASSAIPGMPLRSSMKDSRNNLPSLSSPVNVGGMPLRSSMKGSRNNLRSSSLNSSLKSVNSNASSIPSMEGTNCSIESNEGGDIAKKMTMMRRNVSFTSLEIRSYNVTLGNTPTQNGPPVSLDWEYDPAATQEHCIEEYEADRAGNRHQKHEMRMPKFHREYLLMHEAGFSGGEIKNAMEEARRCARQREKTARRSIKFQPAEEAFEKAKSALSVKKIRKN